jgi:HPt (histidine-containing phosphotransfer) domain-containing protein
MSVFSELQQTVGADFVEELVDTFLVEAPAMVAELVAALGEQDTDKFRRTAHSIKSNANVFGAQELARIARDLEMDGAGENAAEHAPRIAALERACVQATEALKVLRDA